jgi:hypothetical protein
MLMAAGQLLGAIGNLRMLPSKYKGIAAITKMGALEMQTWLQEFLDGFLDHCGHQNLRLLVGFGARPQRRCDQHQLAH